jgi:transcriptional regulator with XRE-family HTH domain
VDHLSGLVRELAAARRQRGISQGALAARLELSQITVGDWEVERDTPLCGHFLLWACALGLAVVLTDESGRVRAVIKPPKRGRVSGERAYRLLAAALREVRENKEITQQQVADKLGVSQWTVRMWESAQRTPRLSNLAAWAEVLGCRVELSAEGGPGSAVSE